MGNGDWDVPREVLAALPSDPHEQLEVARRITAMAIDTKVSKLESDVQKLQQRLADKEHVIRDLQVRVLEAEGTLQETSARLSQALDEQAKLVGENTGLQATVKKLNRDVTKLEAFKRTLMQSLQEEPDEDPATRSELVEKLNSQRSLPSSAFSSSNSGNASKPPSLEDSPPRPQPPISQHLTPQQTPTGSPRWQPMSSGSPRRSMSNDVRGSLLPLSLPTSKSTTAPNSPPNVNSLPGRTPRVDGKEFFRQARNRLSYEQFSSFLANIKELNAHRQTREETLRKADETFGAENKDLYVAFDALLSRHITS